MSDEPTKLALAKIVIGNIISKKTASIAMGLIYLVMIARNPSECSELLIYIGGFLVALYMLCDLVKQWFERKS